MNALRHHPALHQKTTGLDESKLNTVAMEYRNFWKAYEVPEYNFAKLVRYYDQKNKSGQSEAPQ